MIRLRISANAANDIQELAQADPKGIARVFALIREMTHNEVLQAALLDRDGGNVPYAVSRWIAAYNTGKNLYRIKEVDDHGYSINKYRIIYGYYAETLSNEEAFLILAIVSRDKFNYELHDALSTRIFADYDGFR